MIHYHGTPITPQAAFRRLAGRSFCVSHANPQNVGIAHEIGQSVMLDNGAFTHWKAGRPCSDWSAYYLWVEKWLRYRTTWSVIPDVIGGCEEENDALIEEWPHGSRGAPVWHLHESMERLGRLVREWPIVCLGSSGKYADPGTDLWHDRMVEAMDIACDGDGAPRAWLHMMRGLKFAGGIYPFASADSTNIARNHATVKRDPLAMALEIDARQTPAVWVPRGTQASLWR